MVVLLVALIAVLLLDQAVKLLVVRRLVHESISLGSIGTVKRVPNQMWMARSSHRLNPLAIWILWIMGACALDALNTFLPVDGWFCGLLFGGSFSHAFEMTWRGHICDYVCLRFWPAFDLADVAIAVGAIGLAANLLRVAANAVL
jgi:signal peptidase II